MTVQINYKNGGLNIAENNLILFVGENFEIKGIKKVISKSELSYISELLKNSDIKKD